MTSTDREQPDPPDPALLHRRARAARSAGRYDEAVRDLRRAVRLAPGNPALLRSLIETEAAAAIARGDWRMLSRCWAESAGGLSVATGPEPGLPPPLIRLTIGGGRLLARFGPRQATSPSDHPVIIAMRLLRNTAFWLAIDRAVPQPVTILVDVTDGDGPARTLPHLAGSSRCAMAMAIPDFDFVAKAGHRAVLASFEPVPWSDRKPVAFWRGSPTGEVPASGDALDLPRVRLCRMAAESGGRVDAGLHQLVDLHRFPAGTREALLPLVRPGVAPSTYPRWRYQIYVDGHASAWGGMFERLATGSPVLKVAAECGWRQWYYDRLVPWQTVVPVASDLSDLFEKVDWLRRNDDKARAIGAAAVAVVRSLTPERAISDAMDTVLAASRALQAAEGRR